MRVRSLPRWSRIVWLVALALSLWLPAAMPGRAQDHDSVSHVNGEPIAWDAFHARVRLVRWQYLRELEKLFELTGGNLALTPDYVRRVAADLADAGALGDAVLHQLEEEQLLWQAADQMGAVPTAEDAQERENEFFSLWTGVAPEQIALDAQAQAFIADWYADATAASGMSAADIRALFETDALRRRLFDVLAAHVPTEELAVHTRHILCSFHPDNVGDTTPPAPEQRAAAAACAENALRRLLAGESFADVARALSDDSASAAQGGDVGWVLISYLAESYAEAARTVRLNTPVGPIETEFGLHVIEVLDRRTQQLTDEEYADSQQGYFRLWVESLWQQASVERSTGWETGIPADPPLDALDPDVLAAVNQIAGP